MINCFTTAYNHLKDRHNIPNRWKGWNADDMDLFVKDQKRFLARKEHIGFFKSFCEEVETAQKDDVILTRRSVGIAINRFSYWVYSEDLNSIIHKKLNKDCLIMRVVNG